LSVNLNDWLSFATQKVSYRKLIIKKQGVMTVLHNIIFSSLRFAKSQVTMID